MTDLQHVVAVHHSTISKVDPEPAPLTRRYYGRTKSPEHTTVKVDPAVWELALAHCDGHPNRIEIIDAHTVRIHNQPWR